MTVRRSSPNVETALRALQNLTDWVRKRRVTLIGASVALVLVLVLAAAIANQRATAWVEGSGFREMLDKQTSKGLKLKGTYSDLHRVGFFGLSGDNFKGKDGERTIVTLDGHDFSGTFNPLGVILRRWEIDSLHIKTGTVMLQKTEPIPGAPKGTPWPPWWALFWPYRVHLADVKVDDANILWKLNGKESGIYGTRLEITPNGRDFEYDAHDGDLKTPMTPALKVVHAHMLIRKPRLYCSEFILGDDALHPTGEVRLTGEAGLQDDRSMDLKINIKTMKVAPWLPEKIRTHVSGVANGQFEYKSSGTGLETGEGKGVLSIEHGSLHGLQPVHQYVTITGSPDPGEMELKVCRADVKWEKGAMSAEDIEAECEGVFRVTGHLSIGADKTLSGKIEFGLTDRYIAWLPTAKSAVFTRDEGAYHFATVHFSGTAQKPVQDLSPRIAAEVGKSPLLALKLFFNQAGEWFSFE